MSGDILSLLRAKFFTIKPIDWNDRGGDKVVHFIIKNELPVNMRATILSATADEFIYRKLFDDIEFYDLSLVEMKGFGTQYSNRNFSRRSFDSPDTIKWVKEIDAVSGTRPTITFHGEKYRKHFKNTFMHIENIEGTDKLKGQDIQIIGTPYQPPYFYRLWSSMLGVQYSQDADYSERLVEYNGFEFWITTFENKELQKIQFHFIESSLVQGVGRARLIREPASVTVFSKYPLVGFKQKHLKDMATLEMIAVVFNLDTHKVHDEVILTSPTGRLAS